MFSRSFPELPRELTCVTSYCVRIDAADLGNAFSCHLTICEIVNGYYRTFAQTNPVPGILGMGAGDLKCQRVSQISNKIADLGFIARPQRLPCRAMQDRRILFDKPMGPNHVEILLLKEALHAGSVGHKHAIIIELCGIRQ